VRHALKGVPYNEPRRASIAGGGERLPLTFRIVFDKAGEKPLADEILAVVGAERHFGLRAVSKRRPT